MTTETTTIDWPTITVETPYGPLRATVFASPTTAPGTTHATDGRYTSHAHAFGRDPEPPDVGASVLASPVLVVNRVTYSVQAWFTLRAGGAWVPSGPRYHPLGSNVTAAARRVWQDEIEPDIIAALGRADIAAVRAVARQRFEEDVSRRVGELTAEADRLAAMIR